MVAKLGKNSKFAEVDIEDAKSLETTLNGANSLNYFDFKFLILIIFMFIILLLSLLRLFYLFSYYSLLLKLRVPFWVLHFF